MKDLIQNIKVIILSTIVILSVSFVYAAWTDPTANPTGGNTDAPINVGTADQIKNGGLIVNAFSALQNAYFAGNVGIGTASPEAKLHVVGNIKIIDGNQVAGKVLTSDASGLASWQTSTAGAVPSGVIVMWSGSVASIPSGWVLCNGANGTPDLRDRFIMGAGSTYAVGNTGGATTHNHGGLTGGVQFGGPGSVTAHWLDMTHQHPISSDSNIPPYYALAYIMKL